MGQLLTSRYKYFTLFLVLIFQNLVCHSQIVINEFSASNATQIEDVDYSDYSDWIELYNAGATAINIKGYYITDNLAKPDKWEITESITIDAGGYILIWADGNESGLHTSFKLSADGEEIGLYNANLILQDSVIYSEQRSDVSCGRKTDGNSNWGYFTTATPWASNTTTSYTYLDCNVPEFSMLGGFYSSSINVELSSYLGGDIYYTLDGSEPELTSAKYTQAIPISSTTILRARIFKTDHVPGDVATSSYFINENSVNEALPVVSIATDPDNFWDSESGIYVQDYKPDWEVPINIELFENNGADRAAFNELAGTKVNGLNSWELPQKMLGIYFRKQYGSGNLSYALVNQRKRFSFDDFSLRASGSDWSYTMFRDILGQQATLLNMDIDIMGFKPSILYVNGEYMGIHNIREKVNEDYIVSSYNMDADSFDMVENETYAENGDLTAYNEFLTLLNKDLSSDANYNAVAEVMDIENFTDYVITEMCVGNFSIDHNVMAWKPKDSGKWKWILMDLDRGFTTASKYLISFYKGKDVLPLSDLLENDGYTQYFGKRLAAHLYTSFHPDRMKTLIAERKAAIAAEMPSHIARWEGTTSNYGDAIPSYSYWEDAIADIQSFVEDRPAELLSDLTNYGFSSTATLSLSTYPADAGTLSIEGLTIPESTWSGPYLKNLETTLTAKSKPGYSFKGWTTASSQTIIPSGDSWYYSDLGTDLGTGWKETGYDHSSWSQGNAELGYGDGDETTTVSYGSNSNSKYITTYFIKNFTLTETQKNSNNFTIKLLKDDGAIVYINGQEVIRANMGTGTITYTSTAVSSVSGTAESAFTVYSIASDYFLTGENTIAVEVHQISASSSDLSFDLELSCSYLNSSSYLSTSSDYNLTLTKDTGLIAVYESSSQCVIPEDISSDLTLNIDCSPYLAPGDITIESGATLNIDPGVEIWMPEDANIYVNGVINANGTEDAGISILLDPSLDATSWGIISFKNTDSPSMLKYVTIEDASMGTDLSLDIAAITAFNADLVLDHMTLENNYGCPIMARYSDITLTNSKLHSDISGDNINVKYGYAYIANCTFTGNDITDCDAIDYDEVENGVVRNCLISNFNGYNSDALDIGEKTSNILIDSVTVYNLTDKGVSLGQQSSGTVQNSTFINCTIGIGVKDSSKVTIDQCTFYGNVDAIACYEKNLGYAGGNAVISNSILSNSSDSAFYIDPKSTFKSNYCLTDVLEDNQSLTNVIGNPLFESPGFNNFNLLANSPAINAGWKDNTSIDIGTNKDASYLEPRIMISKFFINPDNQDLPEFIALYNPSSYSIDISNYTITKGVTATIPENTFLDAQETLYITDDVTANSWWETTNQLVGWEDGKLSNNGENIQLENSYGQVVDFFNYDETTWPADGFGGDNAFQLISPDLDNHFAESWKTISVGQIIDTSESALSNDFTAYPNPTNGDVSIKALSYDYSVAKVYSSTGLLITSTQLDNVGLGTLDLSGFSNGIYIIKIEEKAKKILLVK